MVKFFVLFVFGLLLIVLIAFLAGVVKGGVSEGAVQALKFLRYVLIVIGLLIGLAVASVFNSGE